MVRLSDLLKQLGEDPVRVKQREETLKSFDDLCFSTFAELLHKFMHCTETELEKPKKDGMALGEKEKEGQSFMSKVPNAIVPSWHPPIAVNLPYSQPWLIELIQREAASMPETPVNGRKGRKRQVRDDPPVRKREPRQKSSNIPLEHSYAPVSMHLQRMRAENLSEGDQSGSSASSNSMEAGPSREGDNAQLLICARALVYRRQNKHDRIVGQGTSKPPDSSESKNEALDNYRKKYLGK